MAHGFADKKWLWIGVSAAVVVAVVACLLVFVVFKDGAPGDVDGPEVTLQKMFRAMEAKDIDGLVDVMDPEGIKELEAQGLSIEDFKEMRAQEMTYDFMEFTDIEMQTQLSEDGRSATVTILEGKLTVVVDGETTVQYASENTEPLVYELILRDGDWYLSVTAGS